MNRSCLNVALRSRKNGFSSRYYHQQNRSYISFPTPSQIQAILNEKILEAWNQLSTTVPSAASAASAAASSVASSASAAATSAASTFGSMMSQKTPTPNAVKRVPPHNGYDDDDQDEEIKQTDPFRSSEERPHVFRMITLHDDHLLTPGQSPLLSHQDQHHRMQAKDKLDECTVYVRGFLSSHTNASLSVPSFLLRRDPDENPGLKPPENDDRVFDRSYFRYWRQSHIELSQKSSHMWGDRAYGWEWPNGRFPHQFDYSSLGQKKKHEELKNEGKLGSDEIPLSFSGLPLPVATLTYAAFQIVTMLYRGTSITKFFNPTLLLGTVLQDVALTVVVGYLEFQQANVNAQQYAHLLRDELVKLNDKYKKVRIVAHSLGAKHAVEAIKLLSNDQRPSEVHLCAGAFAEKDYNEIFKEGLTNWRNLQNTSYSYWNENDSMLNVIFRAISLGESAIGCSDLLGKYDRIQSVHVGTHHFTKVYRQLMVHNMYAPHFHKFAR